MNFESAQNSRWLKDWKKNGVGLSEGAAQILQGLFSQNKNIEEIDLFFMRQTPLIDSSDIIQACAAWNKLKIERAEADKLTLEFGVTLWCADWWKPYYRDMVEDCRNGVGLEEIRDQEYERLSLRVSSPNGTRPNLVPWSEKTESEKKEVREKRKRWEELEWPKMEEKTKKILERKRKRRGEIEKVLDTDEEHDEELDNGVGFCRVWGENDPAAPEPVIP